MAEYIEREAAIEAVDRAVELFQSEYNKVCYELDKIPAAYVVEVVHGEWERSEDGRFVCNNCKQVKVSPDMLSFLLPTERWNFCPNCGAKMDGERRKTDG